MADGTAKPVIFISYSHKDEPEHPRGEEVQWLSFVRTYLQPAVKDGVFDLWVDQNMPGGTDWEREIEEKLRACDIFILLVSANSMASDYIVDKEIAIIRERQKKGESVHFYPLLLTPTPKAGLDKVKDKNLRPRDAKPFSGYSLHDRTQHMTEAADEIAALVEKIAGRKIAALPVEAASKPAYVHISGLPETAYERLVGRDDELKRLDEAWADGKTNILSLIAEGGAGKSALVNEWLKRLQVDNYRGAEVVLGWSFYSQGTKERATSADEFLNWALDKLGIKLETTSASAKGEAIAEAMMQHRVLLVLDGVEPLQHGLDTQLGQLKDQGLRALLRRFAATPPAQTLGLIVLTSRLPVKDISRWQDSAASVIDVERLSDEAGAALLRDNGVWGTDKDLKAAAHDFGGHPLALGQLASFLKQRHFGDVRRRDHIRAYFADPDDPRHDHAKRVMESYEKEWLTEQPILLAIMEMVGLFDRPATGDCLNILRAKPAIEGLTDEIVHLDDHEWQGAVVRLREAQLLAPLDSAAPDSLDAHPLVREWFGERLRRKNEQAWNEGHQRIYQYLRTHADVLDDKLPPDKKVIAIQADGEDISPPQIPLPLPSPATKFTYIQDHFDVLPPAAWKNSEARAAAYHKRACMLATALAGRLANTDARPDISASVDALIVILGSDIHQAQPDQLRLAARSINAKARAFGHPQAAWEISPDSVGILFELADVLVDLQGFVRSDVEAHERAIRQLDLTNETAAEAKVALDLLTDAVLSAPEIISESVETTFETAAEVSDSVNDVDQIKIAVEGGRTLVATNLALAVARELNNPTTREDTSQNSASETRSGNLISRGTAPSRKRKRSRSKRKLDSSTSQRSWSDFTDKVLERIHKKGPDAIGDATIQAATSVIKHAPKTVSGLAAAFVLLSSSNPILATGAFATSLAWITYQLRRRGKPPK
jgi:hypothetical protein